MRRKMKTLIQNHSGRISKVTQRTDKPHVVTLGFMLLCQPPPAKLVHFERVYEIFPLLHFRLHTHSSLKL